MDSPRYNLPAPANPKRLGVPYHGLLRNGTLTLSNGRTITWPALGANEHNVMPNGDCYLLRVPGTPPVDLTPSEVATEAAAGREWRDYALLVGRGRNYGGHVVGAAAWLYAAPDGTVWRIECPQLNTTNIRPISRYTPPVPNEWYYPPTLDFHFNIRRFGVFAPEGSADLIQRSCMAQSLGAAHRADEVNERTLTPAKDRRFLGDGYAVQYMPINIDDVNSTGSRAVIAVNRGWSQGIWSSDYPAPMAWLEVAVLGSGAGIQVQMSVLRVARLNYSLQIDNAFGDEKTTIPPTNGAVGMHTIRDTGQTYGSSVYVPDVVDIQPLLVSTGIATSESCAAGAYYDADDVLQWVETVGVVSHRTSRVSGTSANKISYGGGSSYDDGNSYGYSVNYKVERSWSMQGSMTGIYKAGAKMGPNTFSLPDVIEQHFVIESGDEYWHWPGQSPVPQAMPSRSGRGQIMGLALGDVAYEDLFGQFNTQVLTGVHAEREQTAGGVVNIQGGYVPERYLWGGAPMRILESVRLVRVTNRVYAVVCSNQSPGPWPAQYSTGIKVLAIGTPEGWTSTSSIAQAINATFNPGTRQLAFSLTDAVGWV